MAYKTPISSYYQEEFLDQIVVAAPATSVSFGTGGNGQFNRALDGNVDTTYILESYTAVYGGASFNISLNPNGITTNRLTRGIFRSFAGTVDGFASAQWVIGGSDGTSICMAETFMTARAGKSRQFGTARMITQLATFTLGNAAFGYGLWEDTTTNITSLVISSNVASSILAGSVFRLHRRLAPP